MSGGHICRCPESKKPLGDRRWYVTARNCNRSAFNGYHETPSAYSEIRCEACLSRWRTTAAYVVRLASENAAVRPETKQFETRIIETATGEVAQRMGPMAKRAAERVARGASINLDHTNYHVDIVEATTP